MEYTAFISYRRSDGTRTANWLRGALQSFRLPRGLRRDYERPVSVFLDTAYERGADDFYERTIRPALMASRHLIVLATPDAAARGGRIEDDWMAREIADFGAGPNAGNLIVVRAAGAFDGPLPGNLAETYPNAQIIDLRGVADWSPLNLGRKAFFDNEKLKIMASLLDIPLEVMPLLRREEERRRQSRIGLLAGLSAAVVLMSAGVSVYSIRAQFLGQQSLDQSLSEAEAALTRIGRQHWDDNRFLRDRDHGIGAMCAVASRLAVEASRPREPEARAICDLEYLLPYVEDSELSDQQRDFVTAEFERLGAVATDLLSSSAGGADAVNPLPTSAGPSRLALAVAANASAFHDTASDASFAKEQAIYLPVLRASINRADKAADAGAASQALRSARDWLDLALFRYGERLNGQPGLDFDADQQGLATLSDIAHAVARLHGSVLRDVQADAPTDEAGDATDGDLAWTFETLQLIGSIVMDRHLNGADIPAARRASVIATAALERLPAEKVLRRLLATLDEWRLAFAEIQAEPRETDAFTRYDQLARMIADAHARAPEFAAMENAEEANLLADYDPFLRALGDELHLSLDAIQDHAMALADDSDPAGASTLLGECHARREALYPYTHPESEWPRVFLLETEVQLISLQVALADPRGAAARRLAQWRNVQARALDRSQLGAVDASRYDAAVDTLVGGHHSYLDGLRDEATALQQKGDHRAAAELLERLWREDREWDLVKPEPSEFDRIYAGEVALQLADSLDEIGDADAAHRTRTRVIRELLPLTSSNNLAGRQLERAEAVWRRATAWANAAAVDIAGIEPIETLEAF